MSEVTLHKMRAPCRCGCELSEIRTRGGQDVVHCVECGKYQYNAPKTETGRKERTITTVHQAINPKLRARVLIRANGHCELCGKSPTSEHPLHVGHMLSVKDGMAQGLTEAEMNSEENLASMCDECNLGIGDTTVPIRLLISIVFARERNKVNQ